MTSEPSGFEAPSELDDAEARWRLLFEQSPDGIVVIEPETARILEFNETAHRQLGYSREEFARLTIPDIEAAETPEETRARIARVTREGRNDFETRHRTRQGDIRNICVVAQNTQLLGRTVYHCIWRDVTDQKRLGEQLVASEHRYRRLFESAKDGILILDAETAMVVDVNPFLVELLGFSREVFLGKKIWELGFFNDIVGNVAHFEELIRNKYVRYEDKALQASDGRRIDVEFVSNVYEVDHQSVIQCNIRDMRARKLAEEHTRRLTTAVEQAAETIAITDASATILYVNPAFERTSGYTREEAIGQNPRMLKSGKQDADFYRQMWAALAAGAVWGGHLINKRKDGTLYEEDVTISPVRTAGGELNYVAVKRDVTHEVELEHQLRHALRMETVGRLAGGVAHDFNNLLTVINGVADLALMNLEKDAPIRKDFLDIRQAGERGASLTRQLLAFSRKQIMKLELLDLGTLVAGMQGMIQRLISENITLVVAPAGAAGCVMADPAQIGQVVMNLAVNARDAMLDGGTLTIETRNVELDQAPSVEHASAQRGPHVMLSISDTGAGMDEATRERIFEPFFTTKDFGKGTGLGLSTVYGVVEQSGGTIEVDSEPGKGTTFRICLPRVENAASRTPSATAPSRPGTETILVVEDEPGVRRLAERILQMAGYTVLKVGSGEEALSLMERHSGPVDLVLTDVVLPGISGRELAERLAGLRPRMKVLYTSGYTDDAILRHGVLDEALHFIGKPYGAAALTRKVREVLDLATSP